MTQTKMELEKVEHYCNLWGTCRCADWEENDDYDTYKDNEIIKSRNIW